MSLIGRIRSPSGRIIWTGDDLPTQEIVENSSLPDLLNLLTQNSPESIKKEACLTISNVTAGIRDQMQAVLLNLLTENYMESTRVACWTISNIMAGNRDQIQAVIDAGLIAPLVRLLRNPMNGINRECAWAIANATCGGTHDQIKFLVREGCIRPLCDLLLDRDPRIVMVCLEGLENILKVGEAEKSQGISGEVNVFAQMIKAARGLSKIEYLINRSSYGISGKVVQILDTYWGEGVDISDDEPYCESYGGHRGVLTFNFARIPARK